MGIFIRKSKKLGKRTRLNMSKSGLSASVKVGPFTVSSRGNASVRLGKGVSGRKKLW